MLRLIRRGSSSLERSLPLSLRSLGENSRLNLTEKTCLLCKCLNYSKGQIRDQSSSVIHVRKVNAAKKNKSKRKKLFKTSTDILEVTNASSAIKKANVTKLTPSDLNLLASTNFSLNELYKVKQLIKESEYSPQTYSNLAVEGPIVSHDVEETVQLSKVPMEPGALILPPRLHPILPLDITKTTKVTRKRAHAKKAVETHEISQVEGSDGQELHEDDLTGLKIGDSLLQPAEVEDIDTHEQELQESTTQAEEKHQLSLEKINQLRRHRDIIASKTLAAYIEVCNHQKNPNRGFSALTYHQSRARRGPQKLSTMKSLQVYYALLKGFSNKGDYVKLGQILDIMRFENVDLDVNCYVAIFECLGRINIDNHYLKDIRQHMNQAQTKGITPDKIMNEGIFLNDERQKVLNAFTAYDANYVPKFEPPKVFYDNHLVNHLNSDHCLEFRKKRSNSDDHFLGFEKMNGLVETQMEIEEKGYVTIKSVENKDPPTEEVLKYREALKGLYQMWEESAQMAFSRDLAILSVQRHAFNLEPYLRSIPQSDMVAIVVQEAIKIAQGSETYSPQAVLLHKMLGGKVYSRYRVLRKQKTGVLDKTMSIHKKYCENYALSHTKLGTVPESENYTNSRIQWQWLEHDKCRNGVTLNMGHQPWVPSTLIVVGKFLYRIIMHDLKIDVNSLRLNSTHKNLLPAFYTIFRSQGRIVKEEVKPHPVLARLYKMSQPETLTFPANEIPMVCPPVPWTSIHNGGYILSPADVVRLPFQASCQRKRMVDADPVKLYPNFDALNQLSAVPWKVNQKILDVILEVFRNGGSSRLDVPEPPSSLPPLPPITPDMDKPQKYQILREKLQQKRKKAEMYSLWCDCLYRLSLANYFRDGVFWLPHNMDFRGRVYPVPPHLNHLGSDLPRSMLVFAEARPLGPKGLDWLKIHLINLTGLKKRDSVEVRLKYADEVMDLILDSADNPLIGKRWWADSDEPWQTLACCMEIADVVRSGVDPAEYWSHFPVHQDGSCNGLQHYAALGRDSAGAFSVNLAPSEVPQDVYSAVVELVEGQRVQDEIAGNDVAKVLKGFIRRKVIKQTIMTTVYGVTRYGAKLQIAKQLKDIDDFPKEYVWSASAYLTSRTFDSLRTMFTSTREIQVWFTECARVISGVGGHLVEWVTPLGLPVVQPYIKHRKMSMPHGYEGFLLDQFEKPNVMKQKNAFPPNFIHSLDSSHMMLTSLHCQRAGITFVSVHDCYWTHPSTVQIMNEICRQQFVALHSEPILEDLSVFLWDTYSFGEEHFNGDGSSSELNKKKLNKVLRQLPQTGDFDIKKVLDSVYFFS